MEVLISAEQIRQRIAALARQISADYAGQPVTLLGVLTGSLMFMADLVRQLDLPTRIGFIQASSYRGTTTSPGKLEIYPGMIPDIRDRQVLLLDDILDSGQTLCRVMTHVKSLQPGSLRAAVLLRKIGRQTIAIEPDYVGFEIPNVFVVGFGLDYNDEFRQLPYVAVLNEQTLEGDHAHVVHSRPQAPFGNAPVRNSVSRPTGNRVSKTGRSQTEFGNEGTAPITE